MRRNQEVLCRGKYFAVITLHVGFGAAGLLEGGRSRAAFHTTNVLAIREQIPALETAPLRPALLAELRDGIIDAASAMRAKHVSG